MVRFNSVFSHQSRRHYTTNPPFMAHFVDTIYFQERIPRRAPFLSPAEAEARCDHQNAQAKAIVIFGRNGKKEVSMRDFGPFKSILPQKVQLEHLHGLILTQFYLVVVKSLCRALQEILVKDGFEHLKGSYFEICCPSIVKRPNPFGGYDFRMLEVRSEPILIEWSEGNFSFAVILGLSLKGVYKREYMVIQPILMRNDDDELVKEANAAVVMAAKFIFKKLKIWTPRQYDVAELILEGRDNKEIAAEFGIVESTVETHKRNMKKRVKEVFPDLDHIDMAFKLREMGCI